MTRWLRRWFVYLISRVGMVLNGFHLLILSIGRNRDFLEYFCEQFENQLVRLSAHIRKTQELSQRSTLLAKGKLEERREISSRKVRAMGRRSLCAGDTFAGAKAGEKIGLLRSK